ncbi:MAG: carbon-nitrogen hydrolase family protein [Proteobacteria bacterium]|nr:carbon-nitrogen hydrolase family protein [Pseudomonadota bacterium]
MRVAVVQFEVSDDVDANLQTCLRMIDKAQAECDPDLMVLPEYCNHPPLWRDAAHCYAVAQEPDGSFLAAIAAKAKELACMIQVNVTVRHGANAVRNSNAMFGPDGTMIGGSSKSFLISGENFFLEKPDAPSDVMETPFGKIGMYSCMDGVSMEVTRSLSLRGAQLLSNSLCSFAPDEDWLHLPVRAAENKVFVAAANKVGRLVLEGLVSVLAGNRDPNDARQMMGGGASQIVAPDGTVLVRAPVDIEAVVWADIDLGDASIKARPDGSDIFADRRPELYGPIVAKPNPHDAVPSVERLLAAVAPGADQDAPAAAASVVRDALAREVDFLVLPELTFLPGGTVADIRDAVAAGGQGIAQVRKMLATSKHACLVATSVVHADGDKVSHRGVLIGGSGVVLYQDTLHSCGRHPWVTTYADEVATVDLPAGRFGLVVGGDAAIPETFRLLALKDAYVVGVPTRILERWEVATGLLERAAENRLSLVVATQPSQVANGLIITLDKDFTQGTVRADGQRRARTLSWPIAFHADRDSPLMTAPIYPNASANRLCFVATDLVDGRPWHLAGAIAQRDEAT